MKFCIPNPINAPPAGKVRIYKDCTPFKYVANIYNSTCDYVDLDPGVYNNVALQLHGLNGKVFGIKPGGQRVEIYKKDDFSDTAPHVINPNSTSDVCLPESVRGSNVRGIKITIQEGFGEILGFNLMEILLMLILIFIIYLIYSKYSN